MAEFRTDVKHDFDLEVVKTEFEKCHETDDHLVLENYVNAYVELNRFFRLSGRLFGFVAKDLEEKIDVLHSHRNGKAREHYVSIQSMIEYEKTNGLLTVKGKLPSGSRSLLRLHRASEFIFEFMEKLKESNDNDKTAQIASSVYERTLARFHPWIVQKMAGVAMYMLPSRKQLLETMCKQNYSQLNTLLSGTVTVGRPLYAIIQKLYGDNDLLDLP